MSHISPQFDLSPEAELYDPLSVFDSPAEEADGEFVPSVEAPSAVPLSIPDFRPAAERIDELLGKMPTRRRILMGVIAFCGDVQPAAAVNEKVDELQAHDASVFTAASYCMLLEQAGALERVAQDGSPYEESLEGPRTVNEGGVEYLEPTEAPAVHWRATGEGLAAVERFKPTEKMESLFMEEPCYRPIYRTVLELASREGGVTTPLLSEAIDNDPAVQSPRKYAARFVEKLEQCEAVLWMGDRWEATDAGREGLVLLADDAPAA